MRRWLYPICAGVVLTLFMMGSLSFVGTVHNRPEEHEERGAHEDREVLLERSHGSPVALGPVRPHTIGSVVVRWSAPVLAPHIAPPLHPSQFSVRRLL